MAEAVAYAKIGGVLKEISPTYDKVVIKPFMASSKTILIPSSVKDRHQATEGVIMAVGPASGAPFLFNVGDQVIFSRYCGLDLVLMEGEDEVRYRVLDYGDVAARIKGDVVEVQAA